MNEMTYEKMISTLKHAVELEKCETFVTNFAACRKLMQASTDLRKILISGQVEITQQFHNPFNDCGSVAVRSAAVGFTDPAAFFDICATANNVEIVPYLDGTIEIGLSFTNLKKEERGDM